MDIASVVKIFNPTADDAFVAKRDQAVDEIVAKLNSISSPGEAFALANDLSEGLRTSVLGGALGQIAFTALKTASVSFTRDENEAQLLICALAGVARFLEAQSLTGEKRTRGPTIFGAAILSSLSFEETTDDGPVDKMWRSIVSTAGAFVELCAVEERSREDVGLPQHGSVDLMDDAAVVSALQSLSSNALLDREELNFLWWCIGDWSAAIGAKVSSLPAEAAIVVAAVEGGSKLEGFPLSAHAHATLRNVNVGRSPTLTSLRETTAPYSEDLSKFLQVRTTVQQFTRVFPVLSSLLYGGTAVSRQHAPSDWAKRILLEVSLTKAMS